MKRLTAVILLVIVIFSLVACGENQKAEKYCWNCGEGVSKEASFCGYCGTDLNATQSENSTFNDEEGNASSAESIEGESQSTETSDEQSFESENSNSLFYSTNDYETAKNGNTGVFSYKSNGGSYDVYWIIDFEDDYVYFFTDDNGESACDKVKIVSGDLNGKITVTWYDSGDQWSWYLHFKYENQPETLIVNDHLGIATEFTTTDLTDALSLRDTKKIITYDEDSNHPDDQQTSSQPTQDELSKNQRAIKSAEEIANTYATVFPKMVKEILVEDYGYTNTQANYAIKNAKIDWEFFAVVLLEQYVRINEGEISENDAERYLTIELGFSDSATQYAFDNADVDWSSTEEQYKDKTPTETSAVGTYTGSSTECTFSLVLHEDGTIIFRNDTADFLIYHGFWTQNGSTVDFAVQFQSFEEIEYMSSTLYTDGIFFNDKFYTKVE